jgi:hypothetical protein
MSPSARRRRDCVRLKATVPRVRASGVGAVCGQMVLDAAFDLVLLDFKAADAGEIGCLVIGFAPHAERPPGDC